MRGWQVVPSVLLACWFVHAWNMDASSCPILFWFLPVIILRCAGNASPVKLRLRATAEESLALAPNMTAKYGSSVLYYVRWPLACRMPGGLPLTRVCTALQRGCCRSLLLFVGHVRHVLAAESAATIKGHLAGLKHYLVAYGPVDWSNLVQLHRQLKGSQHLRPAMNGAVLGN